MKRSSIFVAIAIAFSAITTAVVLLDGPAPVVLDAASYWQFGESVADGDWLLHGHAIAYRTPGFPWFVAMCQRIGGVRGLGLVVLLQGCMCVLLVPLCAWIASRLTPSSSSEMASTATAIFMSLCFSRLYLARAVLGESLFVFVMMLHLACVIMFVHSDTKYRWAIAGGFTLALMILVRPIGQWLWLAHFFLVVPLFWQRDVNGSQQRMLRFIASLVMMAVIAAITISPWWVRNSTLFGKPFLTEFVGRNIWIVTFQDQAGAGLPLPETEESTELQQIVRATAPGANLIKTWEVSDALFRSGMADDTVDRLMRTVALQSIKKNPAIWSERMVRRIVNFFRCISDAPPEFSGTNSIPQGQLWWHVPTIAERAVRSLRFSPHLWANMFVTFVIGIAWLRIVTISSLRLPALWLGALIGYFAVITAAIEIPDYRYRLVVEPLMAIVGGLAVGSLFGDRAQRHLDTQDSATSPN